MPRLQTPDPDQTLHRCLAHNIRTSIRWIPSGSDKGSREQDNACDSNKSLANHLGSSETQTLRFLAQGLFVNPTLAGSPTRFGEVAIKHERRCGRNEKLSASESGRRWSRRTRRDTIPSRQRKPRRRSPRKSSSQGDLRCTRPADAPASDKEKVTADHVRPGVLRYEIWFCALEKKSVTRKTQEVHAASVHEFFGWSGFC